MNKRTFYILTLIFIGWITPNLSFADDYRINLRHQTAFPGKNLTDFVYPTSFKGFGIEYKQKFKNYFAIGFSIDYQSFSELRKQSIFKNQNFEYIGDQYRYFDFVPTLFKINYTTLIDSEISFFIGFGAGPYFIKKRLLMGFNEEITQEIRMGILPEIGFNFPLVKNKIYLNAAFHRNILFQSMNHPEYSYNSVSFGLSWLFQR